MLRCADIAVMVSDYADGVADQRARRIVEQHIQLCPLCAKQIERSVTVAQQLRRMTLLPPGVASRTARARRRLETHARGDRRRLEEYPFYVSALLAATLVILTLATMLYFGL